MGLCVDRENELAQSNAVLVGRCVDYLSTMAKNKSSTGCRNSCQPWNKVSFHAINRERAFSCSTIVTEYTRLYAFRNVLYYRAIHFITILRNRFLLLRFMGAFRVATASS